MNKITAFIQTAFNNWKTTSFGLGLIGNGVYLIYDGVTTKTLDAHKMHDAAISIGGGLGLIAAGDAGKSVDLQQLKATIALHEQAIKSGDTSVLTKETKP